MNTSRSPRRVTAALAVVALAAFALVGCSSEDDLAGDAARVGATNLTVDTVTSRSAEVQEVAKTAGAPAIDSGELNRAQVSIWVQETLSDIAAEDAGIDITTGDVDRFLKEVVTTNSTSLAEFRQAVALQQGFWIPPSGLEDYATSFLQQQELGRTLAPDGSAEEQAAAAQKALTEVGDAVGVIISPRYGTWDPTTGQVVPTDNDLSSPPPTGAPQIPEGLLPGDPSQG